MATNTTNTPPIGQSLALFCATALIHRRIQLRRERQTTWWSYVSENGIGTGQHTSSRSQQYANADGEEDVDAADIYHLQGLRKRASFDGYASFSATGPSSGAVAPTHSAAPTANGGYSSAATSDTDTNTTNTSRKLSWTHEDDLRSSFVIYGGDEMDDDEVQEQGQAAGDEKGSLGGVMTSAGASAAKRERMRIRGETNASTAAVRQRSSPIQEGTAEDEGSIDGDGENDEPGAPEKPWGKVGGLLRQMSGISRGVSFFVEGADDDGMSYHERGEDDMDSSGTSVSRRLDVSTSSGVPSIAGRRCSSQPSMTDLWSLAQQSLAQQSALNKRESAKKDYNSRIMPNKVVLIRHGQSEGNVEEGLYATTPDNAMKLTALGWDQARMAGRELKNRVIAKNESIHFVVSPYVRTVETFHGILSAWCDPAELSHIKDNEKRIKAWYGRLSEMGISWHEDPRIREQDFGNYQDPVTIKKCKRERHKFGTFYYRFPHGESASDVYDRVSTFLDSLWRSFDLKRSQNYVLVTHGISIRILLSRYFRYSIDQFNMLANPKNCDLVVLGHDGKGRLRLEGRHELVLKKRKQKGNAKDEDSHEQMSEEEEAEYKSQYQNATLIKGYQYQDRLRVLPREWRVKRKIRLSYDDGQEQSNTAS
mmetsp:Transcript_22553/g.48964  ORF Transcript_22553/g.48964 Transcript_22553/m.48964 type:complete len:649 (-) Transcript_22553:113-2059(-)